MRITLLQRINGTHAFVDRYRIRLTLRRVIRPARELQTAIAVIVRD